MRKIAFFVEGQTEQLFTVWIIKNLFHDYNCSIEEFKIHCGVISQLNLSRIGTPCEDEIYIQVFDCEGDGGVISRIKERMSTLLTKGFSVVIGLRDLHPKPLATYTFHFEQAFKAIGLKLIPTFLHFSIHETEAWFLSDKQILLSISPTYTAEVVYNIIKFNYESDDVEKFINPAMMLAILYEHVGKLYNKSKLDVENIINAIDPVSYFNETVPKVPQLKNFVNTLNSNVPNPSS